VRGMLDLPCDNYELTCVRWQQIGGALLVLIHALDNIPALNSFEPLPPSYPGVRRARALFRS